MNKTVLMIIFVVLAAGIIGFGSWYSGQLSQPDTATTNTLPPGGQSTSSAQGAGTGQSAQQAIQATQTQNQNQPMDLQIKDDVVGTGAVADNGNYVTVNYVGTLDNGKKFDSSYDRNQPFSFVLGGGQVIKGWDQGVLGMKVGGKRELVIPADLGYGANGAGTVIPPNATLHFTVELLAVSASAGQ